MLASPFLASAAVQEDVIVLDSNGAGPMTATSTNALTPPPGGVTTNPVTETQTITHVLENVGPVTATAGNIIPTMTVGTAGAPANIDLKQNIDGGAISHASTVTQNYGGTVTTGNIINPITTLNTGATAPTANIVQANIATGVSDNLGVTQNVQNTGSLVGAWNLKAGDSGGQLARAGALAPKGTATTTAGNTFTALLSSGVLNQETDASSVAKTATQTLANTASVKFGSTVRQALNTGFIGQTGTMTAGPTPQGNIVTLNGGAGVTAPVTSTVLQQTGATSFGTGAGTYSLNRVNLINPIVGVLPAGSVLDSTQRNFATIIGPFDSISVIGGNTAPIV